MANKVILKAETLDGYLTEEDNAYLAKIHKLYEATNDSYKILSTEKDKYKIETEKQKIIDIYSKISKSLQEICCKNRNLKIFPFETENDSHAEASRIISKLRDVKTTRNEFIYYTQKSYEMLFKLAYLMPETREKEHLFVKTPVEMPVQQYSVHQIPDISKKIENSVMCVMLRGALLPSMIMSKEIEGYSISEYLTPFALFKIKRDDSKHETNMEYILDLDNSFFDINKLNDKDLIFADPMNATGGSFITIVNYLKEKGVKYKSISFFNIISALKGSLRVIRAIENCTVYTLWLDPVLNESAYILPGLGDAGDRLNGYDNFDSPRTIIQLIENYGSNIVELYRSQVRMIESIVLGDCK
ncbi:MAG: uracil phosphoribosyltransferase [Treponema sp.]|nr:uracil phosphoribosyltransferase [Treponema sp.]